MAILSLWYRRSSLGSSGKTSMKKHVCDVGICSGFPSLAITNGIEPSPLIGALGDEVTK